MQDGENVNPWPFSLYLLPESRDLLLSPRALGPPEAEPEESEFYVSGGWSDPHDSRMKDDGPALFSLLSSHSSVFSLLWNTDSGFLLKTRPTRKRPPQHI